MQSAWQFIHRTNDPRRSILWTFAQAVAWSNMSPSSGAQMRFPLRSLFWFTAVFAVAALVLSLWWRSIDGVSGNILAFLMSEDTVWADSYSDDSFRSVRVGITRDEVYVLLGPPLEIRRVLGTFDFDTRRQNPGEVVECWTRTPENSDYRVRQIVFNGNLVVDKSAEFYVD